MSDRDRFAAFAASDPSALVRSWKALTGGKAVVGSPPFPAPEIVHSFGMLPVLAESVGEIRSFSGIADAWIVSERFLGPSVPEGKPVFLIPSVRPRDVETALDLLEAIAGWAGSVSGRVFSEGRLRNSLAAYRERDALVRLLTTAMPGAMKSDPPPDDLLQCGNWLPVETHSRLVAGFLAVPEGATEPDGEKGDPMLHLARKIARNPENP